jgi:hypothetical protein
VTWWGMNLVPVHREGQTVPACSLCCRTRTLTQSSKKKPCWASSDNKSSQMDEADDGESSRREATASRASKMKRVRNAHLGAPTVILFSLGIESLPSFLSVTWRQ